MQDFVPLSPDMQCNAIKTLARSLTQSCHYSFRSAYFLSLLTQPEPGRGLRFYSRLVPSPQGRPTIATVQPASVHIRAAQKHRPQPLHCDRERDIQRIVTSSALRC